MSVQYLTPDQIIALWRQEVGPDEGKYFVRDAGLVASAAARPGPIFGTEPYDTLIDKAAALMHSLVCNHAFSDGNKRAGLLAADVFLQLNGACINESDEEEIFSIVCSPPPRSGSTAARCCAPVRATKGRAGSGRLASGGRGR